MLLVNSQAVISNTIIIQYLLGTDVVTFLDSFCEGPKWFVSVNGVIHSVDKVWTLLCLKVRLLH